MSVKNIHSKSYKCAGRSADQRLEGQPQNLDKERKHEQTTVFCGHTRR